jgi:hypothetical protein
MLGVLVEILSFDGIAAAGGVFGQVGVPLIVATGVCDGLARIARRANARGSQVGPPLLILIALRPERPSARTLVQGSLRFLRGG